MAEHAAQQRLHVARVRGEVVEAIGRQPGVAEAAQVGGDHLEAGFGQGADVAPPDPLRLRPAVDEQQRVAADPGAHEGDLEAVADLGPLDREGVGPRRLARLLSTLHGRHDSRRRRRVRGRLTEPRLGGSPCAPAPPGGAIVARRSTVAGMSAQAAEAMVQHGPRDLRETELPLPDLEPGAALLRLDACGLCGSDVESLDGESGAGFPRIMGHEIVGTVVATGPGGRRDAAVGERVAVDPWLPCGGCRHCLAGMRAVLLRLELRGDAPGLLWIHPAGQRAGPLGRLLEPRLPAPEGGPLPRAGGPFRRSTPRSGTRSPRASSGA